MADLSLRLRKALAQDRTTQLQEWMDRLNKEYATLAAKAGTIKKENDREYRLVVAVERYEIPKPFWELLCSEIKEFREMAAGKFQGPSQESLKRKNRGLKREILELERKIVKLRREIVEEIQPLKQPNIGGYPVIQSETDELKVIVKEDWIPILQPWEKKQPSVIVGGSR